MASSQILMRSLTQQVKRLNVRTVSSASQQFATIRSSSAVVVDVSSSRSSTATSRQQQPQLNITTTQQQQQQQFRYFSNGGVGDDEISALQNNADYSPDDIMDTFEDTSYVDVAIDGPPDYSHMTNEELEDTSTIPGWSLIHSPPKDRSIPRGALVGTVVSTKMQKTVNVAVDRFKVHPKYGKRLRFTRKFMAHDEGEVAHQGDLVMIVPCHRISKHKHFMLREIVRPKGQL